MLAFLRRYLPYDHGVPSDDTVRRFFRALAPNAFQERPVSWAKSFAATLAPDAKALLKAVRGHWGIENSCHWSLDMTFREDESRIRDQNLRENFAWMNRFLLSLLKQHPSRNSVVGKRRGCAWNDDFLLEVLTGTTS